MFAGAADLELPPRAEVLGDWLAVERDEAALTWAAMDQPASSDINPITLLAVRIVIAPRVPHICDAIARFADELLTQSSDQIRQCAAHRRRCCAS